jgi:hypothetical protein
MTLAVNPICSPQVAYTEIVTTSSEKPLNLSNEGTSNETSGRYLKDPFKYKILPLHRYAFPQDNQILISTLKRIEEKYPKIHKNYLTENRISSEKEILDHFIVELSKGCCAGRIYALNDKIHRQESSSLKEIVSSMRTEDYFYFQILPHLHNSTKKTEMQWEKERIGEELHTNEFFESARFSVRTLDSGYRCALENALDRFFIYEEQNFVGALHIPEHVIGFQYGPQGYFIYDPADTGKGLYWYRNNVQLFFQELSRHALDDTHYHKYSICEQSASSTDKDKRKLRENIKQLYKQKIYFSFRPLAHNGISLKLDAVQHLRSRRRIRMINPGSSS